MRPELSKALGRYIQSPFVKAKNIIDNVAFNNPIDLSQFHKLERVEDLPEDFRQLIDLAEHSYKLLEAEGINNGVVPESLARKIYYGSIDAYNNERAKLPGPVAQRAKVQGNRRGTRGGA